MQDLRELVDPAFVLAAPEELMVRKSGLGLEPGTKGRDSALSRTVRDDMDWGVMGV